MSRELHMEREWYWPLWRGWGVQLFTRPAALWPTYPKFGFRRCWYRRSEMPGSSWARAVTLIVWRHSMLIHAPLPAYSFSQVA